MEQPLGDIDGALTNTGRQRVRVQTSLLQKKPIGPQIETLICVGSTSLPAFFLKS